MYHYDNIFGEKRVDGAVLSESQLNDLAKPLARPQPYCFPQINTAL